MNKIDPRTGKVYPSVTRRDTIDLLAQLPEEPDTNRALTRLRGQEAHEIHVDATRDWTLNLDIGSLTQYGAFGEHYFYEGDQDDSHAEAAPDVRPVEWFQLVGQKIHDRCTEDDELWELLNRFFDQAIAAADVELGFNGQKV